MIHGVTKIDERNQGYDASSKKQTNLPDLDTIHGVRLST